MKRVERDLKEQSEEERKTQREIPGMTLAVRLMMGIGLWPVSCSHLRISRVA